MIGHAAELRFNFGNRIFSYVPANPRTASREHGLSPALIGADFSHHRSNDVLRRRHASVLGVDGSGRLPTISSDFGRTHVLRDLRGVEGQTVKRAAIHRGQWKNDFAVGTRTLKYPQGE
jgi:hypothetical protein